MNHTLRYLLFAILTLFSMPLCIADVLPKIYTETFFDNNRIEHKKYGFINENGDRITEAIYDKVSPFAPNGLALVSYNNHYGYINTKGEYFIQVSLRDAHPFDQFGLAAIKIKTKWGLIDNRPNVWVMKDIFDYIDNFQPNGLAIVKHEKKYGLIDTLGNVVLPVMYNKIEDFDDSGYAFIKLDNKYGIADRQGRAIVAAVHKDKKNALLALNNAKTKFSKVDITLADISKSKSTVTAQTQEEDEAQKQLAIKNRQLEEQKKILSELKHKQTQGDISDKAPTDDEQHPILAGQPPKEGSQIKQQDSNKIMEENSTLGNYISANLGQWSEFLDSLNLPSDEEIRRFIEEEIAVWQKKGEFEPTAKWKERVNESTRAAKVNALADSIYSSRIRKVEEAKEQYRTQYQILADRYCSETAVRFATQTLSIMPYDADNQTFLISTQDFGDFLLPVPLEEAPDFKQEWDKWKSAAIATFVPNGDEVALKTVKIGKYTYDSDMDASYVQVEVDYNFNPVDVVQLNNRLAVDSTLAMNTPTETSVPRNKGFQTEYVKLSAGTAADVDVNIPQGKASNSNTFAVVIANSEYAHASKVAHAENDGRIMSQYFTHTLGIPEGNVATFINATYGQMASAISMLQDIGDAYQGSDFNLIFYYVGHGLPDDDGKKSYILPVDIDPRMVSICMPLEKIYADLGTLGAKNVTVMVDACFSGTNHGEGMLVPQSMGVAMKPKSADPVGNMVVLTATDGNETAFPYEEKSHGLFTYWLLKKLQETSGQVTFGELSDYVIDNVKKTSVTVNKKPQTPTVATSPQLADSWRAMKFGN